MSAQPLEDLPRADGSATPAPPAASPLAYRYFLVGVASWFAAWGMQLVLFQWLVVEVLAAAPSRVGTAQMAVMLPSLLLLLLGGAAADRVEPGRLLALLHALGAAAAVALALAVAGGWLSYSLLIVYALCVGTLQAFMLPARDVQLWDVGRGRMSRAVAGMTITQHAAQVVGAFLVGLATVLGAPAALGVQAGALFVGTFAALRTPRRAPARPPAPPLHLRELRAGLHEVATSPVLRPIILLGLSVGLFMIGPYLVILPLMVRDVYGGGAREMSLLVAMFPLGAVISGALIMIRQGMRRPGRALILSHLGTTLCLFAIALGLPFWGLAAVVLIWGISGAVYINGSRSLFQEAASDANRARVHSVHSLGVLGTAPIGALIAGFLTDAIGLHSTMALEGCLVFVMLVPVALFTRLPQLR